MGKVSVEINLKLRLSFEEVLIAIASQAGEYGYLPRNREEALDAIKGSVYDSGTDFGDACILQTMEEDWPLIADMNELPPFEEVKEMCLEFFPELKE